MNATRQHAMLQQVLPEEYKNIFYYWLMMSLAGKAIGW